MTPHQQQLIEDRANRHAELNYGGTVESAYVKQVSYHSYVKGAIDQASQSYSREEVTELLADIINHGSYFGHDAVLKLINEFTEKHNPDDTNTI